MIKLLLSRNPLRNSTVRVSLNFLILTICFFGGIMAILNVGNFLIFDFQTMENKIFFNILVCVRFYQSD